MNCTPFSVYAIRYARHSGRRAADNYLGHVDFHDAESDLDYYVWLLRRDDEIYLVDTGFGEAAARQRGRELFMRPAQGLALLGVQAADVRDVILTHLHYDHAGTLADFPNATFHVQDAEPAYATGRCMCHAPLRHPFDVEDIVEYVRRLYAGRVAFHQGSSELAPGLSLHLVGGHTAGLQIVRVWTAAAGWCWLPTPATYTATSATTRRFRPSITWATCLRDTATCEAWPTPKTTSFPATIHRSCIATPRPRRTWKQDRPAGRHAGGRAMSAPLHGRHALVTAPRPASDTLLPRDWRRRGPGS